MANQTKTLTRDERKARQAAAVFTVDPRLEEIMQWRDTGDKRFADVPPEVLTVLPFYERGRRAFLEAGGTL